MKPKFLDLIQLAILLTAIAIVVGSTFHSHAECKAAVESVGHSLQGEGVSGPLGWIWSWFTWFTYLFFITFVMLVVMLFLYVLGTIGWVAKGFASGIVWMRDTWRPPPLPGDTVITTKRDGTPVTLLQMFAMLREDMRGYKAAIERLDGLTAALDPPPPPKTAEEIAAEKDAVIAEMQAELKRLRDEANRKSVVVAPSVVPSAGGAA